jgi:hypothetical protein
MNCESSEAILQTYTTVPAKSLSEESEEINEIEEEEEDEQELSMNDFYYKYKSEIYDGEIVMDGESNANVIDDKDLEDVLNTKNEERIETPNEVIEEVIKPPKSSKKESTKQKTAKSKRNNNNQVEKGEEKVHICEVCANQYKYRHALEVHMRR